MSLFDFLSKEKRDQRSFDKNLGRVLRKTRAKDERMDESIHYLSELGTDEALYGLLRRYDVTIKSESMDRFEKELIQQLMVAKGVRVKGPLLQFLGGSENVTWPIQILREICEEDEVVQIIVDVLDGEVGKDTFKPDKKVRLLELLQDHVDDRVPPVVMQALDDFDGTVRYGAVETLFAQQSEAAREALLKVLTDPEEESGRIKKRILEGVISTGWTIKGFRKAVEAQLESHQWIDKKGTIKQRANR